MPDKDRENLVVQRFLELYNSDRGTKYVVVARPEEDPKIAGTYDSLCEDEGAADNRVAIEEKSLHLSPINARDNKVIGQLLAQVEERVAEKGIIGNRQYCFFPDFRTTPKKKDRGKYVGKLAEIVERAIREHCKTDVRRSIDLPLVGLDCMKSLTLISARENSGSSVDFPFHVQSNQSRNVANDILNAVLYVVVSANSSLKIPKQQGATTVLLVTDYLAFGDTRAFRQAMGSIPLELHAHIDKVFMVGGNVFDDSCSVYAIK